MKAERRFSWGAGLGVALLLAMAYPASASAGNIFMKNGYIIQGRIVDRDATSVILGWPNGKVAIARRFVESVEYEHAEEERIRQLERARQERPEEEDSYQPTALAESTDEGELPASLEMFIQKYQLEPLKHVGVDLDAPLDPTDATTVVADGGVENPAGADPTAGTRTPDLVPDVTVVDPEPLALESVKSDATGVALRPPKTWKQQSRDGFLSFSSVKGDGLRPNINIVSMDRGPLSVEQFVELLRKQQQETLVSFELLSEGATRVGNQDAYEISGRCSFEARSAIVRQILVAIEDRVWLFSVFVPEESDAAVSDNMALVDAMLDTVTFRTDGPGSPTVGGAEDPIGDLDRDSGLDGMGTSLDTNTDTDFNTDTGTDEDTDTGADVDTDVDLDTDTGADVDTDVDLDTDAAGDANLDDFDVDLDSVDVDLDDLDLDLDTPLDEEN